MASYRNLNDLLKDVVKEAKSRRGTLGKAIAINQEVKGMEYAKELQDLILENLNSYYSSYTPVKHKRTGQQKDIFNGAGLVSYNSALGQVQINFGQSSMQINAVKSDPHMSFVPHLLNSGWRVKGATVKKNNRFMFFEGSFFIDNAIAEFNSRHASEGVRAMYY